MISMKKIVLYASVLTSFVIGFLSQNIYASGESTGKTYTNDTNTYEVSIPAFVSFDSYNQAEIDIDGWVKDQHELTISVNSTNNFQLKNGDYFISYTVNDGDTEVKNDTSWTYPQGDDISKYEEMAIFSKNLSLKLNETGSSSGEYIDNLVFTFTDKECYELNVMPYVSDDPSETMIDIRFDVYVDNQKVGDETWAFSHYVPVGSTYSVKNISLKSENYIYNGETSYEGTVNENKTVNINVEHIYKTITFDANGGTCSESSRQVLKGNEYGELPTPTYTDSTTGTEYDFLGWYKAGSTDPVESTETCDSNVTLYARWNTGLTYKLVSGNDFMMAIDSVADEIVFTDEVAPSNVTPIDLSANGDGSVVGWGVTIKDGTTETKVYKVSTQDPTEKVIFNEDCADMFAMRMEKTIDFYNADTSQVKNMYNMFFSCFSLKTIKNLTQFNTSNVENMSYMFGLCSELESLDLSSFDTSKVTNMNGMFAICESLKNITFSNNFNTSKVTSMDSMFYKCLSFTTLDVSVFDTSNVTSMESMFGNCSNLVSLDLSNFNMEKVESMMQMFEDCKALKTVTFGSSKFGKSITKNLTNIESMFHNCYDLITLDLTIFDTTKVIHAMDLFKYCINLESIFGTEKFSLDNVDSGFNGVYSFGFCGKLPNWDPTLYNKTQAKPVWNNGYVYINAHKVTFDANGGTLSDGASSTSLFVEEGQAYSTYFKYNQTYFDSENKSFPTATLDGETTTEWYTASGIKVNVDDVFESETDITLYAHWSSDNTETESTDDANVDESTNENTSDDGTETTVNIVGSDTQVSSYILKTGVEVNALIPNEATSVVFTDTTVSDGIALYDLSLSSDNSVVGWLDEETNTFYISSQKIGQKVIFNVDSSSMFKDKTNLTSIDFNENIDISSVTSMSDMFSNCTYLVSVYVESQSDLDKLKSMSNTPENVIFSLKDTSNSENN